METIELFASKEEHESHFQFSCDHNKKLSDI